MRLPKNNLLVYSCVMVLFLLSAAGGETPQGTLEITVTNVRSESGDVYVALYNTKKGFPLHAQKAFMKKSVPSKQGEVQCVFENVPYGTYAVSLYHDENNNRRLDRHLWGQPKEGIAVSGEHSGYETVPSFRKAQFTVREKEKKIDLSVYYVR